MRTATRSEGVAGWRFAAPALVLIGAFFIVPVAAGLLLSLTDFDIYAIGDPSTARFVGLRNYTSTLANPAFWTSFWNTLYFVVVGGPLTIATALGAAMLVNARLARFKGLFRTVYFAPVVTTMVAVAVVWRYVYHPRFGLLNRFLGLFGVEPINWLGDPHWTMPAIILLSAWKNFGYSMVIFVAGLQSVPDHLYEAARIDGASAWQQFRSITLPMLRPTIVFVSLITMIGYFQLFAEPYVLTGGALLNNTYSLVLFMYTEGFRWWNMGFAAAVAFLLFLVILAASMLQNYVQKRTER